MAWTNLFMFILCANLFKCTYLFVNNLNKNENNKLLAVVVMFRHGDRAPTKSFPTDKYFNRTIWPMGFGHMTKVGITRQYKLGQWFRQRYNTFLSDIYLPEEIYVHSTNKDRALVSAYANLAGLYPPKNFQVWNENIPWQPIPVHTTDQSKDDILVFKRKCNNYKILLEKAKQIVYPPIERKYKQFFQYISKNSGWNNVSIDHIKSLRSTVGCYQSYNISYLPEWAKQLDYNLFDYLSGIGFRIATSTNHMSRLYTGPFFHHLIQYFDRFSMPSPGSKPKFLMISGHDSTTSSALGAMGADNFSPVNYGETIIWELKRRNNGSYFVNVLFKRGEGLEKLSVNGCQYDCDYDEFKFFVSNVSISVDKWLIECNQTD